MMHIDTRGSIVVIDGIGSKGGHRPSLLPPSRHKRSK